MKYVFLFSLLSLGSLLGCAHTHPVQGEEKKSEIPAGIRVAIGSKEVKEGETLDVLKTKCRKVLKTRGGSDQSCNSVKVGEASVLKVLDHDSAIVEPMHGLKMETDMKVEKKE